MATKKSTQTQDTTPVDVDSLPVDIQDRFTLVRHAGLQIAALAEAMRPPLKRMHRVESYADETVVSVMLDRLQKLAAVVEDLGCPEDDEPETMNTIADALSLNLERG